MGLLPPCKLIEEGITEILELANSVVSDINAGVAAINGNENIPVGVSQGSSGGSGGLEISLAMELNDKNKFEPPVQGASNIHLPTFDAIGSVLSSWVDRQSMEII